MSFTGKEFDWRAFWADLLGGAGRSLLQLEGSDAARAAQAGIDYLEVARRRRALAEADHGDGDAGIAGDRAGQVPTDDAPGPAAPVSVDPSYPFRPAMPALPPKGHAAPLSVDPSDHPSLMARLRQRQRPARR